MKKSLFILFQIYFTISLNAAFLVDDCNTGTNNNSIGGVWVTYNDGFSIINITANKSPAYAGNYCKHFEWTINAGAPNSFAGVSTSMQNDWSGMDMSTYHGVRFYARGTGTYSVRIGTDETRGITNHYCKDITITTNWKLYELPFNELSQTWGDPSSWDPATVYSVELTAIGAAGVSGEIFLDNLEFYLLKEAFLLEDAETGTINNTNNGEWIIFDDGYSEIILSTNASPAYEGNYCKHLNWTINSGSSYPIAGAIITMKNDHSAMDMSSYYGVRFYARGSGRYSIKLRTDITNVGGNHYNKEFTLTPEWKLYELPYVIFRQTWGEASAWDPSTIHSIEISAVASTGSSGEIFIDNIEFFFKEEGRDPNIIIPFPKTNQVGYLRDSKKYFCISADAASAGDNFFITDQSNNVIKTGSITGTPFNDTLSTGEFVWKVDFSDLTTSGVYKISVNNKESHYFNISDSVFNGVFRDALRCFYLIRCGIAENDPITGINRQACHLNDARILGGTGSFDATGGWHNAGDLNKFVNEIAISVAYMLWLYELKPDQMKDLNLQIPESDNQISDILDEARWGLTWLLKMQSSDGSVYHKVSHEPNSCDDMDPNDRYAGYQDESEPQISSAIDVADFAAVMSQASRVYLTIDNEFSALCLEASKRAWDWLNSHPKIGQSDPAYIDPDWWQEYLWAEGEMARTLNSNSLRSDFSAAIDTVDLNAIGWNDPQIFGYIALYYDDQTSTILKEKIKSKIMSLCYSIEWMYENTGYASVLDWWEYWWESNEWLMSKAVVLLFGYEMSGDPRFRDAAIAQLNYMLGLNSLDKSFVMSHGTNSMKHPFHWIYMKYGKAIPGWCAGGANQYTIGYDYFLADLIKLGTPPAKCYVDTALCFEGSWASNEGETSENAALAFLSGYFYKTKTEVAVSEINIPAESMNKIAVYPTPCSFKSSCKEIIFSGLPANSTLEIYDLTGKIVFSNENNLDDGKLFWNLKDKNLVTVLPGVYAYSVRNYTGKIHTGKIILL